MIIVFPYPATRRHCEAGEAGRGNLKNIASEIRFTRYEMLPTPYALRYTLNALHNTQYEFKAGTLNSKPLNPKPDPFLPTAL